MARKIVLISVFIIIHLSLYSQRPSIELTFQATDSTAFIASDSFKVMNLSQGCDTMLYWPDSTLELEYISGTQELYFEENDLRIFPNYPNPVTKLTNIILYVPERDKVNFTITDHLGRIALRSNKVLDKGNHSFLFKPGNGSLYFFNANWKNRNKVIKIINVSDNDNNSCQLEYLGTNNEPIQLKETNVLQGFKFSIGDVLLLIGYDNGLQSGILDTTNADKTIIFQFTNNVPCIGNPTVLYEGQIYNTIQIFSQCWFKENLNVGTMIPGDQNMNNDGNIEKYCYENKPDSCLKYGGLYQWDEIVQYTKHRNVQGICPPGWHVPGDEEWKILEGAVDSHYGIGNEEWNIFSEMRGFDAGENLKTTYGWKSGGNGSDLYGFSAIPGGLRHADGPFTNIGNLSYFWSSNEYTSDDKAWVRALSYGSNEVDRFGGFKQVGMSVRCVKDNQ